jgi:DNA-directed RNA polymerase III subunit RPC3
LLDKLNRKDVKENPELLGEAEREELKNTEKLVERLEISKSRIDMMVMILRDF